MKFTWKKRLLSVVCAVMAAVMFVGCGSSSSSAAANSGGSAVGSSSTEGGEKERREITATVMQSRNVPGLQKMIDKLAEELFSRLVRQMSEKQGITEQLKASDQMMWVGRMNAVRNAAMEIVNKELIYI